MDIILEMAPEFALLTKLDEVRNIAKQADVTILGNEAQKKSGDLSRPKQSAFFLPCI